MELKAICCVVGAILINLTLGTFYSIGNLVPYVASYMRQNGNQEVTSEHGTWLTASYLLGQGSFIILGSYIEQRFDNRVACIVGCIIHCASTFATIWAIEMNFPMVILIYGLGSGLGCGSAYMASIIAAQKWFPSNKGVFTGVIVAGFGFGGLIFTNLQTLYMNPDNVAPDADGYFQEEAVNERVPSLFLYMGLIFAVFQSIGCSLAFPPPKTNHLLRSQAEQSGHATTTIVSDEVLPEMRSLSSMFKYRVFYVIGVMMILVAPGVTFVNSLGKRYGQAYIQNDRFLATVVAVAAVANALGRLFWGYLTDKFTFSVCFVAKVVLFSILIVLFPFKMILSSQTLYFAWMLGLFFGFSGTFVLFPVFVEQVFGSRYNGTVYGVLYLFLAFSSIVTSLLIQVTVGPALAEAGDQDDKFMVRVAPCALIALSYCLAVAVFVLALPVKRLETAVRRRKEAEMIKNRNSLFQRQDLYPLDRNQLDNHNDGSSIHRENSLGSIVRYQDNPTLKAIGKIGFFR